MSTVRRTRVTRRQLHNSLPFFRHQLDETQVSLNANNGNIYDLEAKLLFQRMEIKESAETLKDSGDIHDFFLEVATNNIARMQQELSDAREKNKELGKAYNNLREIIDEVEEDIEEARKERVEALAKARNVPEEAGSHST